MMGFYIGLIAVMGMVLVAFQYFDTLRKETQGREYNTLAMDAAKRGFEEGLSYFRRNTSGVAVSQANKPASQAWVNPPWPYWPDDGFQPMAGDTDIYIPVSTASGALCAAAIIRDYPLHLSRSAAAGTELAKSQVWGRYVIKRQGVRNWSPGSNTYSAFTDPEAAHDLTAYRDFSNSATLGSGNYWSLVSRGYVYRGNGNAVPGVSDDVTNSASTVMNTLTSTPCPYYPNCYNEKNQRLLLGSAKVYGELFRIVFQMPQAALFVSLGSQVTGNPKGVINGTTGTGIASSNSSCPPGMGGTGVTNVGSVACGPSGFTPSVGGVFPGLDKAKLQAMSNQVMGSTSNAFVGDQNILPDFTDPSFTDQVARSSFYYLKKSGPGVSGQAGKFIFTPSDTHRFQGTGLIFVDGDLSLTAQAITSWSGVIFVDGNAYINGPAELYGTLVVTGSQVFVGGNINKAFVEYSADAVDAVKSFLEAFRVDKPSVVTSYN
jgi:hypothetical protein